MDEVHCSLSSTQPWLAGGLTYNVHAGSGRGPRCFQWLRRKGSKGPSSQSRSSLKSPVSWVEERRRLAARTSACSEGRVSIQSACC